MVLTINLKPELEAQVLEEAAKTGIDAGAFVVRAIEEQLYRKNNAHMSSNLSRDEALLLQKINDGLPEPTWQEYHDLIAKRRAETLTSEDHLRLIALTETIEETHAERIRNAAELARLRNVPLAALMKQLGIRPRMV